MRSYEPKALGKKLVSLLSNIGLKGTKTKDKYDRKQTPPRICTAVG